MLHSTPCLEYSEYKNVHVFGASKYLVECFTSTLEVLARVLHEYSRSAARECFNHSVAAVLPASQKVFGEGPPPRLLTIMYFLALTC